jgi:hypothetical protein
MHIAAAAAPLFEREGRASLTFALCCKVLKHTQSILLLSHIPDDQQQFFL